MTKALKIPLVGTENSFSSAYIVTLGAVNHADIHTVRTLLPEGYVIIRESLTEPWQLLSRNPMCFIRISHNVFGEKVYTLRKGRDLIGLIFESERTFVRDYESENPDHWRIVQSYG